MTALPYWAWLAILSAVFVLLERVRPWRPQRLLRSGFWQDLAYLVFNGHVLALLLAPLAALATADLDRLTRSALGAGHAAGLPIWAQLLIAFFGLDLVQWCVHNLLHRVPFLWTFHKVHHSVVTMDWMGSMRFHWMEIVVYRSAQHLPLLLAGFDPTVLALLAVVSTAIGHFNHSNLKVPLGPLRYLLNHPTMHIWHHDHAVHGRAGCNFGINLSLWDWIFGTAFVPADRDQPERLGFEGVERFPASFVGGELVPLSQLLRRPPR